MKKIGLICLAVVLAVGVGGLAYATWSQELTITETVNTGEVEVGVRDVGTNDDDGDLDGVPNADPTGADKDPGWDTTNNVAVVYDKDVAHTESVNGVYKFTKEILIGDVLTPTMFYHDVSDTIYSGYPCYAPLIVWEITNNGSIPVKLELSFAVHDPDGLDPFVNIADWKAFENNALVGSGSYYLYEMLEFLEGYQLEPCDTLRLEMTKHIWQEFDIDGDGNFEECPMNATVTYTMTVNAVQWNLYSPPGP